MNYTQGNLQARAPSVNPNGAMANVNNNLNQLRAIVSDAMVGERNTVELQKQQVDKQLEQERFNIQQNNARQAQIFQSEIEKFKIGQGYANSLKVNEINNNRIDARDRENNDRADIRQAVKTLTTQYQDELNNTRRDKREDKRIRANIDLSNSNNDRADTRQANNQLVTAHQNNVNNTAKKERLIYEQQQLANRANDKVATDVEQTYFKHELEMARLKLSGRIQQNVANTNAKINPKTGLPYNAKNIDKRYQEFGVNKTVVNKGLAKFSDNINKIALENGITPIEAKDDMMDTLYRDFMRHRVSNGIVDIGWSSILYADGAGKSGLFGKAVRTVAMSQFDKVLNGQNFKDGVWSKPDMLLANVRKASIGNGTMTKDIKNNLDDSFDYSFQISEYGNIDFNDKFVQANKDKLDIANAEANQSFGNIIKYHPQFAAINFFASLISKDK